MSFTFADLFSGIGGIRKGFENAGGKCVFSCEIDKFALKTYRANFDTNHYIYSDIRDITTIPDHDVLLAGFPCQPFSIAGVSARKYLGKSHGFEDTTQGTLFFNIAKIINAKKPIAVMLENVKNLKTYNKGKTFQVIIETLDELGYGIADADIINSKNFVPQNRERLVIVAFRKDLGNVENFSLREVEKYYPKKEPRVGDILEPDNTVNPKYNLSPKMWTWAINRAEKHKAAGNGFGYSLVTAESRYTRTLTSIYYKDGTPILVDRGKNNTPRRLTPRECARLMGFDDDFVIPVSDTQAYKQFGNSVVVPVFSAIAKIAEPFIKKFKKK